MAPELSDAIILVPISREGKGKEGEKEGWGVCPALPAGCKSVPDSQHRPLPKSAGIIEVVLIKKRGEGGEVGILFQAGRAVDADRPRQKLHFPGARQSHVSAAA